MKYLFLILVCFSFNSNANAFGPTLIKKVFKCSDNSDYSVYIVETSGITVSYSLKAFCLAANDQDVPSCLEDESAATYACYEEFNSLNSLSAGDGELTIINGK